MAKYRERGEWKRFAASKHSKSHWERLTTLIARRAEEKTKKWQWTTAHHTQIRIHSPGDTCRISYSNSAKGAKCRSLPLIPFPCRRRARQRCRRCRRRDDCEKSINPNWKKLGKRRRKRTRKCGCRTNWSVYQCVCAENNNTATKGKRVESTKRSNSSHRRQRRVRENLLLASQMVGYIEIHIAYRASLTNNIWIARHIQIETAT